MLTGAIAASLNHVLRGESWAQAQLKPYAGKTAQFDLPAFRLRLTVGQNGLVAAAQDDVPADVKLGVSLGLAPLLLTRSEAAVRQVEIEGDADFAAQIGYLFKNLRWDVEEDLSRLFGDIAAHRIAQAGRSMLGWQARAVESLARSLAQYLLEEKPLLAKPGQVRTFLREVDTLRDDAERLEKCVGRLERQAPSK